MVSDSEPLFNRDNYDFEQGMETKEIRMAVKLTEKRHSIYKGNNFGQLGDLRVSFERRQAYPEDWLAPAGSRRGQRQGRSFRLKSTEAE